MSDDRRRALLRVLLGTAQVVAAVTTFLLLLWTGTSPLTLGAGAVTLALLLSRWLFRGEDR